MSGSKTEARDKGGNAVMIIGGFGFGEDADGSHGYGSDTSHHSQDTHKPFL